MEEITKNLHVDPIANKWGKLYHLGSTPLKTGYIIPYLRNYNNEASQELIKGLSSGFPLHYSGPRLSRDSPNLVSANQQPDILWEIILKEIELGRVAGPFIEKPFPCFQISPVGLVPKKDNGYRMIHHLSYPENSSINHFIDEKLCSVSYSSVDQAADMIYTLKKGCFLSKTDVKSAFRLLPVSPADFDLLGFKATRNTDMGRQCFYFYDKMLPFGSSISCAIWEKFASFLHWVVQEESQCQTILHYLDDFLFGEEASCPIPGQPLQYFESICCILLHILCSKAFPHRQFQHICQA